MHKPFIIILKLSMRAHYGFYERITLI